MNALSGRAIKYQHRSTYCSSTPRSQRLRCRAVCDGAPRTTARTANMPNCAAWCSQWTCLQKDCSTCGLQKGCASQHSPPPTPPNRPSFATLNTCAGQLSVQGFKKPVELIRNTGGGTSACCHMHPVAAPAGITKDSAVELQLLPRLENQQSRNGCVLHAFLSIAHLPSCAGLTSGDTRP